MNLSAARRRAFANCVLIEDGGNPLEARRAAAAPTFREAAERTFETNRPRWRSGKVAAVWRQSMER